MMADVVGVALEKSPDLSLDNKSVRSPLDALAEPESEL